MQDLFDQVDLGIIREQIDLLVGTLQAVNQVVHEELRQAVRSFLAVPLFASLAICKDPDLPLADGPAWVCTHGQISTDLVVSSGQDDGDFADTALAAQCNQVLRQPVLHKVEALHGQLTLERHLGENGHQLGVGARHLLGLHSAERSLRLFRFHLVTSQRELHEAV